MAALRGVSGGALPLVSASPCLTGAATAKGMPWELGELCCCEGLSGHLKFSIFTNFLIIWEWRHQDRLGFKVFELHLSLYKHSATAKICLLHDGLLELFISK